MVAIVRKISHRSQVEVSIPVKIPGNRLITPIDGIKKTLGKVVLAVIHKNIYPMIGLEHGAIISIVATGVYNVRKPVFVKVRQLEVAGSIDRGETQYPLFLEPAIPLVDKKEDAFVTLRKQDPDIRQPVSVGIPHIGPD